MNIPAASNDEVKDVFTINVALAEEVESNDEGEEDETTKKAPYPWHITFILGYVVCESYSFYGMESILPIYLQEKLMYSENYTTLKVHTFFTLCYFMSLLGACLANEFLDKYKTILYLSCVYLVGLIIKTVGSMTQYSSIPHNVLRLIGLALIALGAGGSMPCVPAFAGDQLMLAGREEREVQRFFSVYYMSVNIGCLIARIVGPELRNLDCLGEKDCYPLAFAVLAFMMFIAIVIIIIGQSFFTIRPADGIVSQILGIIWKGLMSCCRKKGKSRQHWLDIAKESYEVGLVDEIKCLSGGNGILLLFTPIILFWSIIHQTSTTWMYQAKRLDGLKYQVINPALILILIPIFDFIIYPALAKRNILVKPLERMSIGMFLTTFSFLISGMLELMIQANPDNPLHITMQVPQYILLSTAEIMVSITGMGFAYNHASPSMKTILLACWYLTQAFGNMLTTIVFAIGGSENRASGIFLFTGIMLLSSCIFSVLSWRYVPRDICMKVKNKEYY